MNCALLRSGVITAAVLFGLGVAIGLVSWFPDSLTLWMQYLGFWLSLAGVAIMVGLFAVALLPGAARKMSECVH